MARKPHPSSRRRAPAARRPAPATLPSDPLEAAIHLLRGELRRRVERHPQGHLLAGFREDLEIELQLPPPATSADGRLESAGEALSTALDAALTGTLVHRAAFRPGRVLCLRCNTADCEHAEPPSSRQVFAGYGRTGLPRWLELGQLLLERGDPRVDRLWGARKALLAHTVPGKALVSELLAAYRDRETGYRVHGQVVAGWYRIPQPQTGRPEPLAVTLQLLSTQPAGQRRRYGVNVLATGLDGGPLEHVFDRLGGAPWRDAVRSAQDQLHSLGSGRPRPRQRGTKGPRPASPQGGAESSKRIEGTLRRVLDGIAREIERPHRAEDRRTQHARRRHAEGDRPTASALADLAKASADQLLADTRRDTLVVLGAKNRAHLFAPDGRHVTSIRCGPAGLERRRARKIWRPASEQEIAALRRAVESAQDASGLSPRNR